MASLLGLRTDSDKLRNLDFLRIFASVGIVYLHSHEFYYAEQVRDAAIARTQGLGLFVDLFFVISGFVMGFVYDGRIERPRDYGSFMWKRIARLYPLHLVVYALNVVVWAVLLTQRDSDTAPSFSADCMVAGALLVQSVYDCGGYSFNGVTWSISVEMVMYLLLPLLIAIGARSRVALTALSIVATCALVVAIYPSQRWAEAPEILRGLAGFSFGYLVFKLKHLLPTVPGGSGLMLVLCAIALVGMLLGVSQFVTMAILAALFVVAVSADGAGQVHPLVERLCPLGQLTYSIYIWHRVIVLVLLNVVADKLFPGNMAVLISMTAVTLVAIALVSYAGYFLIEVPGRRALTRLLPREERKVVTDVAP